MNGTDSGPRGQRREEVSPFVANEVEESGEECSWKSRTIEHDEQDSRYVARYSQRAALILPESEH